MEVLVVLRDGTFIYDAAGNSLQPLVAGDKRALTGIQEFVKDAPVTLVYVADKSRIKETSGDSGDNWLWADAGFISQNVYLYCASEGLATGVRALIDRVSLAKELGLEAQKVIILAQCVGYPKK
jgi:nitroreductase